MITPQDAAIALPAAYFSLVGMETKLRQARIAWRNARAWRRHGPRIRSHRRRVL